MGKKGWDKRSEVLVSPDLTGDGIADLTTFRPSTGRWAIRRSTDGLGQPIDFGGEGDVPVLAPLSYRDPRPDSIASPTPAQGGVARAARVAADPVPNMGQLASQLGGASASRASGRAEALARLRSLRGDVANRPAGGLRTLMDSILARRGGRPKA